MTFETFLEKIKDDIGHTLTNSVHDITSVSAINRINEIYPLQDKNVLDVGCGFGRDMKYMESLGATAWGITNNYEEWKKIPHSRARYEDMHNIDHYMNFDLIYCSHVLEHSPCPLFVLFNFNEILKQEGLLYVEVPSPQPWSIHNKNHYSIFCKEMWLELFDKAGFICIEQLNLKLNVETNEGKLEDEFWGFFLRKKDYVTEQQ